MRHKVHRYMSFSGQVCIRADDIIWKLSRTNFNKKSATTLIKELMEVLNEPHDIFYVFYPLTNQYALWSFPRDINAVIFKRKNND